MKSNIDKVIIPLAIKVDEQEKLPPTLQTAVSALVIPCIQTLTTRLSSPIGNCTNWSTSLIADTTIEKERINNFLRSPCLKILSFELAMHSHQLMLDALKPLVSSGNIEAYPSRPSGRGRWNFVIKKLHSKHQSLSTAHSLSCTCCSHDEQCIVSRSKATLKKRQEDKALLDKLLVMPSSFGETANNEQRKRLPQSDESMQFKKKKSK
jgi:hypothetical protein